MSDLNKKIMMTFAELSTVGDFLLGSVRRTQAKYIKQDGTVSYHKSQPIFTYTDADTGKQKKVRIKEACFDRVKQLIENGKKYRKLERRLCALMLQRNLPEDVKKKAQFPWPVMANLAEFTATYASRELGGMSALDEDLKRAFHEDAKAYLSAVMSWLLPTGCKGRRGLRHRGFLSCLGHIVFDFQYVPNGCQVADTVQALSWSGMVTPAAKRHITRTGALSGSFGEARETLMDLASADVSVSRVRNITLEVGRKTHDAQENGTLRDLGSVVAPPTSKRIKDKNGCMVTTGTFVGETMIISADGTGAPCTHADTEGVKGKVEEEAGTRELKVALVTVYTHVDGNGHPIINRASTSYMVTYKSACDLVPALRREAIRRGYGRIKRVQFIGDGAEWIWNLWRQAFKDSRLTLDFYHACEYLSVICKEIFEEGAVTAGFKKLKAKLKRYSGSTLLRFLEKEHAAGIASLSEKGQTAIKYLAKRVEFMNYGELRKEHYYIGSGPIESACKFLVAARCKQAGMHWRHENAAYVASIRAALRSGREMIA